MMRKLAVLFLTLLMTTLLCWPLLGGWNRIKLRQVNSRLTATNLTAVSYETGAFTVGWDPASGGSLIISHRDRPQEPLWTTRPGSGFVAAAAGRTREKSSDGGPLLEDVRWITCNGQSVESLALEGEQIVIRGTLECNAEFEDVDYTLRFVTAGPRQLRFVLTLSDPRYNHVYLTYASPAGEQLFRLAGARSPLPFNGERLSIPAATEEEQTAVPFYFSDQSYGLLLEKNHGVVVDTRKTDRVQLQQFEMPLIGRLIYGESADALLGEYEQAVK